VPEDIYKNHLHYDLGDGRRKNFLALPTNPLLIGYVRMTTKKQVFSKPFNLVYENRYPDLLVGPGFFTSPEIARDSSPDNWIKMEPKSIEQERARQVFSFKGFKKTDANASDRSLYEIQLLSQAQDTSEIEVELDNRRGNVKEDYSGVNNCSYGFESIRIIDNVKIPLVIDKTVNDLDMKAKDGIISIYNKLGDVYKIEQVLSLGLLGVAKNRVLVPTRWAITSTDDIVSKELIENEILNYQTIDKCLVFSFSFYQNVFYILFIPRSWGFEQIELWGDNFCEDFESNCSKKTYASSVTGGYYAARLEVAKYLSKKKKQACVIVFRDVSPSYHSKGVWVIRETVREALTKEPYSFEYLEQAMSFINNHIRNGISYWLPHSQLYKEIKTQKKITDFFK